MKSYENYNKRLVDKTKTKSNKYQIHVKYEHGDADADTNKKFNFENEKDFVNAAKFFYECFNFKPNTAYSNMGYFYPIPNDSKNGYSTTTEVWDKVVEIGKKYGISENKIYDYIPTDNHYDGFADLEGIKAKINGKPIVFVFKNALETNLTELPKIGDIIKADVNYIPGLGKKIYGGKWNDYYPNSGIKDYTKKTFDAKVLDCSINFYHDLKNKYFFSYTYFDYVLLLESLEDVLKTNPNNINKLVYSIQGYDPKFEVKFNKERYDGMNYYEIEL